MTAAEGREREERAPRDSAAEERRSHALVRLLAPLVHRLNNSLAVVQGVHELGQEARESEREMARRELGVLGQSLARLAQLARPAEARPPRVELGELFLAHELLLAPLARSRGVALELRADGVQGLEVDARLEVECLAACSALLAADGPAPRRLRLGARPAPRGLVVVLTATAGDGNELAALDALARERGWQPRIRVSRAATCLRLTFPAASVPSAATGAVPARRAGRVLLLHRSDVERELVATVLREHGWTVSASEAEPHAGTFDLALVERRLADEDPSLPARVRAHFAPARVELLEPRLRPGELLRLLSG